MSIPNTDSTVDIVSSLPEEELEKKLMGGDGTIANDSTEGPDSIEVVDSLKLSFNELEQQNLEDSVLIIIMPSSIISKDVTIKGLEQDGYTTLDQRTLQLTQSQIDTLYAYDINTTKPHYQQLYNGWKQTCASDPVNVVLLAKEKAVQCFHDLVANQNSTKKKNRILDPQSVYASSSQENVKRDINMLLEGSNKSGESVSSATMDDTVAQTPSETMDGTPISTEESDQQPFLLQNSNSSHTSLMDQPTSHLDTTLAQETDNAVMDNTTTDPTLETENTSSLASATLELETSTHPLDTKMTLEAESPGSIHTQDSDHPESTASLLSQTDEGTINHEVSVSDESIKLPTDEPTKSPMDSDHTSNNSSNNSSHSIEETSPVEDTPKAVKSSNDPAEPAKATKKKEGIKKRQTTNEGRSTTKKITTTDTKAPSPPAKSKLRATTTARSTKPMTDNNKQQQSPVDDIGTKKKTTMDETKKKVNRIPRVALLANQPKANEDQQKEQAKKSKMSRGSIARLTAPTASSARRRQSTTLVEPIKNAALKPEQRRKRSDTTPVAEEKQPVSQEDPVTPKQVEMPTMEKRNDMPRRVGRKMLIIEKAKATTGDTTTTATATMAPPVDKLMEEKDPVSESEKAPQSPAESSTTSSRPHTPQGSPTTTATTTTGFTLDNAIPNQQQLMGNTSKVKDILGRFM